MFRNREQQGEIDMLIPATPDRLYFWRWPLALLVVAIVLVIGAA